MSQDRYVIVRDESNGDVWLESDEKIIWESDGRWSKQDDDLLEAILDESNFGQPQKDALLAIVGLIPERIENTTEE